MCFNGSSGLDKHLTLAWRDTGVFLERSEWFDKFDIYENCAWFKKNHNLYVFVLYI